MSKKQPPAPPAAPKAPAFDMTTADFPALLERFNTSACDTESYVLATYMGQAKFYEQAKALLPSSLNKDLDFNGDNATGSHEWASALLAAKKLKVEMGLELPVEKADQLIEKARDIYKATHPEIKDNNPSANSCRTL